MDGNDPTLPKQDFQVTDTIQSQRAAARQSEAAPRRTAAGIESAVIHCMIGFPVRAAAT
jgi:hypothetical protein